MTKRIKRPLTPQQVIAMKKTFVDFSGAFFDAFGNPEGVGTWFIWANSGNGKSSFLMQLIKELGKYERVLFNSREEGTSASVQASMSRNSMVDLGRNLHIVNEDIDDMTERLRRRKSPRIVVIDSIQYMTLDFEGYQRLVEEFPKKLFIIVSQARGRKPDGRVATKIQYDSVMKIWVEGYRAISNGRYFGRVGYFDIWPEKAQEYWGDKEIKMNK